MFRRALTLVEVIVVIAIVGILVAIALPAVQYARESARRASCANKLRQIGIALNSYVSDNGAFPPGWLDPSFMDGPPWNQHIALLPALERSALYNSANLTRSWCAPCNTTVVFTSPDVYLCPSDVTPTPATGEYGKFGVANYAACIGSGMYSGGLDAEYPGEFADGLFGRINGAIRPADCVDGLSHTAAFSERVHGASLPTDIGSVRPRPLGAVYSFHVLPPTHTNLLWMCNHLDSVSDLSFDRSGSPWTLLMGYTHLVGPNRLSIHRRLRTVLS